MTLTTGEQTFYAWDYMITQLRSSHSNEQGLASDLNFNYKK